MTKDITLCARCGENFSKRRNLCAGCYSRFKGNYPCAEAVFILEPLYPAKMPTDAQPGTPEKIQVLADRYENREFLWHPMDKKGPIVNHHAINQEAKPRTILRRAWCAVPASASPD